MLLGAAMTASVLRRIPLTRQVTAFFFVAAVSYLVLANGRSFGGVAVPMAFLGMAIAVAMVAETTLTQLAVPDRLRGRIAGVTTLVTSAGSMTSMAAAGWLADRFGARLLLDGGAAVILVGAFLAAAFFLPLRVPGQEG
jgi:MFS family permease